MIYDDEYLAIGCSHTRAKYLPCGERWVEAISKYTGKEFSYRNTCKIASGLIHLQKRVYDLFVQNPDRVKWVVIQKPQSLRFPWWIPDWENRISPSRYDKIENIDLVKGRQKSRQKFNRLSNKEQKEVAKLIYSEELKSLLVLRKLFSNAKIAYFHYWGDHVIDLIHYPELSEINARLGEAMVSEGIENWNMVVDIENIPTLCKNGEIDFDLDYAKLAELKWIHRTDDPHPGLVFHEHVLNKIIEWTGHKVLP